MPLNRRYLWAVFPVRSLLMAGCASEETLDLRNPESDGGAGATDGTGGLSSDTDGAPQGGTPPGVGSPVPTESRTRFLTEVMPLFEPTCSVPTCHGKTPVIDDEHFQFYGGAMYPIAALTDAQVAENLREVLDVVDLVSPESSDLLHYPESSARGEPLHPTGSPLWMPGGPEHQTLVAWITLVASEAAAAPPEPGTPDDPPTGSVGGIPCAALPRPERVRGPAWFARFGVDVNPTLTASCAGSSCHSEPGSGGGLWLRSPMSECDLTWNFLAVQWYIDPVMPLQSLILSKPLDPVHAGREIFGGMSDPRYIVLRDWIQEGLRPR